MQVRAFLKEHLGLRYWKVSSIPVPPRNTIEEHAKEQSRFRKDELEPVLAEARAGRAAVFFVDAAHFVFGTFLCCLWSIARIFVRAASGRQRFNVLGAWNAMTRQLRGVALATVADVVPLVDENRGLALRGLRSVATTMGFSALWKASERYRTL